VPQQRENLIVVHVDGQVLDSHRFATIKLLPEAHNLNDLVLTLHLTHILIHLLNIVLVGWIGQLFPLALLLLFECVGTGLIKTTEERVSLSPPFVRYYLIQIPGEYEVKDCVEDEAGQSIADHVVIENS
jgi:hypothetical protein